MSGSKRLDSVVLEHVANRHAVPKQRLVDDIASIVVRTVLSIQPLLAHTYHTVSRSKLTVSVCL